MQKQHRRAEQQTGNNLLTQRTFLQLAGTALLASAAGCASRTTPPAPTPGAREPTVDIALTAQEASWELAPGKRITAAGFWQSARSNLLFLWSVRPD